MSDRNEISYNFFLYTNFCRNTKTKETYTFKQKFRVFRNTKIRIILQKNTTIKNLAVPVRKINECERQEVYLIRRRAFLQSWLLWKLSRNESKTEKKCKIILNTELKIFTRITERHKIKMSQYYNKYIYIKENQNLAHTALRLQQYKNHHFQAVAKRRQRNKQSVGYQWPNNIASYFRKL
jgi:hypothetical protein